MQTSCEPAPWAIRARGLSKRYRLGQRQRYRTLRESLAEAVAAPLRRLRSPAAAGGPAPEYVWALQDVSFEIRRGETVGVIGRNGAGKSTLLKLLSRITAPTAGSAEIRGRVGSLLEVGTGFHPELTGRDNVYLYGAILGMRRDEVARRFDEIVAFAELERFIDTPVKRYSSGMYLRLAFAVAAHLETETVLVDEALAVGDAAFQSKCLGRMGSMASGGRTVLFVSHHMAAVQHLCRRVIVLARGAVAYDGPVAAGIEFYQQDVLADAGAAERPPHVLFEAASPPRGDGFAITRVELRDAAGLPKPVVGTWDAVTVRITCYAGRRVRNGSAVLEIRTALDVPLLLTSTQPDATLPLDIPPGVSSVECHFDALPLAAGDYRISAGLAIPNKEWLCWAERPGTLRVQPRDVYGSGLAPASSRSLLATPHRWRIA